MKTNKLRRKNFGLDDGGKFAARQHEKPVVHLDLAEVIHRELAIFVRDSA